MAIATPRNNWVAHVYRFASEYQKINAIATGASSKHSRLNCAAAATNATDITTTNSVASVVDIRPLGSSRPAVRGFAASKRASTNRLKPIAALRAAIMQTMIQAACRHVTACCLDANSAPVSANGSANIEWLKRTNER